MQTSHPLFLAWTLEARRQWWGWAILAAALIGVLVALVYGASNHVFIAGVLIGACAAMWVHRRRQVCVEFYTRSWLAAVPVTRRAVGAMVALRTFIVPCVGVLMAALVIPAARGPASLLYAFCIGVAAGSALGWFSPHREAVESPKRAAVFFVAPPEARGDLAALAHWPLACVKAWLQPRSVAPLLLPAAMALPMGLSGNLAIAVLFIFVVAIYLLVLLAATVRVAHEGARWTRSTPLSFGRFAWAVLRNAVLKQLQWTVIAALVLSALGVRSRAVLEYAACWFIGAVVVSFLSVVRGVRTHA